jgi:hypothetical protein
MLEICNNFKINDQEFYELDKKFGKLCWHAAHELKKKNSKNNYTDDPEDIKQELQMSMLRAGSYYKRQVYIERCLSAAKKHCYDYFMSRILKELENLWKNRTRHGANRQKFGKYQEIILDKVVRECVPLVERPDKKQNLKIDSKFTTYCKAIVWNGQKSMGKKITREKGIRSGMVSISEYDYLANNN